MSIAEIGELEFCFLCMKIHAPLSRVFFGLARLSCYKLL